MSDLPPWPDAPSILGSLGEFRYERARADAAMARLRVAVEVLAAFSTAPSYCKHGPDVWCGWCAARETLAIIGELP